MGNLRADILDVVVSFSGSNTEDIAAEVHADYAEVRAILGSLRDEGAIRGATDGWHPMEPRPKPALDEDVRRVVARNVPPLPRNIEIARQVTALKAEMRFTERTTVVDAIARYPGASCAEIAEVSGVFEVEMLNVELRNLAALGIIRREDGSPVQWYPRRTRAERMHILSQERRKRGSMPRLKYHKALHRHDVVRFLSECSSSEILELCEEAERLFAFDPTTLELRRTMIAAKREGLL